MIEATTTVPVDALDTSELHRRISRDELRAFRQWAKTTQTGSHHARDIARSLAIVVAVSVSVLLMLPLALIVGVVTFMFANPMTVVLVIVLMTAFTGFSYVKLIDIWRRDVRFNIRWRRWLRMSRFAESNDMSYVPEIVSPAYSGSVFTMGQAGRASDVMTTHSIPHVEIGNFQWARTEALARSLNRCGYLSIPVDREVPHLYLRSRRSRKFGATFARFQEFSLEGDFGKYFRLYAPGGYERDALYILTPDLMAVLIDEAAAFDIEFIGSCVYFYSPRKFKMTDAVTYSRAAHLIHSVGAKAQKQTRFYSDARTVGNVVAKRGARLSRGWTVAAAIGVLYVVAQVVRIVYTLVVR